MAFEIVLHSSAAPERVLDAIRADLREWRESKIPRDLWKEGVLQVVGEVEPPRFRMRLDRRWHWGEGGDSLTLAGEVGPDGSGGSRVTARCGEPDNVKCVAVFFAPLLLWVLLAGGAFSWGILLIAGVSLGIAALANRGVSRDNRPAAYLVERLEEAVAAATP